MSIEIVLVKTERNFFDELPMELLDTILEAVVALRDHSDAQDTTFSTFKSLRFVSRKAKYHPHVLTVVFKRVSFYATLLHVTFLSTLKTTGIEKYIQAATFKCFPYPANIRHSRYHGFPRDYPDLTDEKTKHEYLHHNLRALCKSETSTIIDSKLLQIFVRTSYNEQSLLKSLRLVEVWTGVLRRLENLYQINITTELDGTHVHHDRIWDYACDPLFAQRWITQEKYQKYILERSGHDFDQLTKRVLFCLSSTTGVKELEIRIGGQVSCNPAWNPAAIDRSVMRRVKTLTISNWAVKNRAANMYSSYLLFCVSAESNNVLTKLDISIPCRKDGIKWPTTLSLQFPHLQDFTLRHTDVVGPLFVVVLGRMAKLQKLTLIGVDVTDHTAHWLDLFDGIRTHPNSLSVSLSHLWVCANHSWPIEFTTQPFARVGFGYIEDMSWLDALSDHDGDHDGHVPFYLVKPQLIGFMRNEVPWTEMLRWEFMRHH